VSAVQPSQKEWIEPVAITALVKPKGGQYQFCRLRYYSALLFARSSSVAP
jgi:hypothetical protein